MCNKLLIMLMGAAALLSMSDAQARRAELARPGEGPTINFYGCILYEHQNFGGHTFTIRGDYDLSYIGDRWNDKVSSIACHPRCTFTIYADRDFRGARLITGGFPHVKYIGDDWNDRVSSAKLRCFP
jgi:hypothetical protein